MSGVFIKVFHTNHLVPLSLIHNDVWCPSNVKNITGSMCLFFLMMIIVELHDYFLMKEKSEMEKIFQNFNMVKNQFK